MSIFDHFLVIFSDFDEKVRFAIKNRHFWVIFDVKKWSFLSDFWVIFGVFRGVPIPVNKCPFGSQKVP